MKTYILRAPETDRKKVLVPTRLSDLTDYADSIAHGKAVTETDAVVTPGAAAAAIALGTTSELRNVVASGNGLAPEVAGLFLITFSVLWFSPLGGTYAGTVAPPPAQRIVDVYVNGAYLATATASGFTDGNDIGTVIARLAANDVVEVYAANNAGAGTGTYTHAELFIAKLAP